MTALAAQHDRHGGTPNGMRLGRLACLADPSGALWCADESLLIVSDLHLEKGSSLARKGILLPPYDSAATLARLARLVACYKPRRIIALGDSFHDTGAGERLSAEDRLSLKAMQQGRDWIWIAGNHDPAPPRDLGGQCLPQLECHGVCLRHLPFGLDEGPGIAGHLHPVAKIRMRGRTIRRRAFACDGQRLIMPAFGAFAGGLNLRDKAFAAHLQQRDLIAHMLGDARVFAIAGPLLLPD
jgi:uncharacterized protein